MTGFTPSSHREWSPKRVQFDDPESTLFSPGFEMPSADNSNTFFISLGRHGDGPEKLFVGDDSNLALRRLYDYGLLDGEQLWPADFFPVLLYGPHGTGKTTLAVSLLKNICKFSLLGRKPVQITAADLRRSVADSIQSRNTDELFSRFESSAIVMIDDVHQITAAGPAAGFLCNLLDRLQDLMIPVVMTMTGNPFNCGSLPPSLASRIGGGLTIPVELPGLMARKAILTLSAGEQQVILESDAVDLLAESFPVSASLLHRLTRLFAMRQLASGNNSAMTIEDIKSFIENAVDSQKFLVSVVDRVADHFGVQSADILGACRQQTTVLARGLVIFLLRNRAYWRFSLIGRMLGGKDHSTIMHAYRKTASLVEEDSGLAALVRLLEYRVGELVASSLPLASEPHDRGKVVHGLLSAVGQEAAV